MHNNDDSQRFPFRKNPRMKGYDYSTPNYYFVTICTWQKQHLFGQAGNLNVYGELAKQGLQEIESHFPSVKVEHFVVMPNHVHAILILQEQNVSLSVVIGQYKAYVTKAIRKYLPDYHVWQSSFHDHVIRNQKSYEQIWLYIDANPINWEKDCFFTE